jgi:hypothetical protein
MKSNSVLPGVAVNDRLIGSTGVFSSVNVCNDYGASALLIFVFCLLVLSLTG